MKAYFVSYILGLAWLVLGAAALAFAALAWLLGESPRGFLFTATLGLGLGLLLRARSSASDEPKTAEALVASGLLWLALPILAAVPYIVEAGFSPLDALFEAVSGFTTTGASVLVDYQSFPQSLFIWRGLSQWVGGIGVTVLFVTVFPQLAVAGRQLFFSEATGVQKEKLTPRLRQTASAVLKVYLALTAFTIAGYLAGGMSFYEAVGNALGTIPTGGYSVNSSSFMNYSPLVLWIATIAMFLGATNLILQYRVISERKSRWLLTDPEFRAYFGIVAVVGLMISAVIFTNHDYSWAQSLTHGFFQTVSIISGTGFASQDFGIWVQPAQALLLLLMLVGGSAGSAAGGFKVVRWLLIFRHAVRELKRTLHPHAVLPLRYGTRNVGDDVLRSLFAFAALYFSTLVIGALVLALVEGDLVTAISASAVCLANVGVGLGNVGPSASFAELQPVSKVVLIFQMWAGRLELIPVFLLFYPETWRSLR